ncbi:bifunctional proline dehydrogenase/L-glutamate gamma-semialdehyde dehydrogenase [Sulfurovum sp.]|uniref:bifunctional proline dehydrogenase/L-glutamate gamma-semialdehyde dehydrogenase n=1 Tax=Sulfurovum sp. TaxID=1969726 RepID=UPI002867C01B|nr:bifunctional proline dehydrogenase/L-glutamate gamma-semialdehyde dehydrogenase [Sulfurovum sp.]
MNISDELFDEAKNVARKWQSRIQNSREREEKHFHNMMNKMLDDPMNKIFLIGLLDQSFRSKDTARVADQLAYIFSKYENTDFFSSFEQILIWLFRHVGIYLSSISIPLFVQYLRNDVSSIIIRGENNPLIKHIKHRRKEGTRVNLNIIGEIVLGEKEGQKRIYKYISALENPDIDYLSIKISTLFSQIIPHAHQWSLDEISKRLVPIYRAAMQNTFVDDQGKRQHKFVNLDMEAYRDLELTIDVFKKTLELEEFHHYYAGIVVQTYLPDIFEHVQKLAKWAKERTKNGGAPIKIRLVKGANQEMELTEASLRGWENVTFSSKVESDANYKVLMDYLLSPKIAPSVHVGIASHNLFDQALAVLLAKERGVEAFHTAEMLEGMSESAYRILKDDNMNVILYAPIATHETFINAIAYLVRRFDENTAEQNFLRHSFGLEVDSEAWTKLLKSYDDSVGMIPELTLRPNRTQDRNNTIVKAEVDLQTYQFKNEPDTDFTLPQNQTWATSIADKWKEVGKNGGFNAAPVIGGKEIRTGEQIEIMDKSQYHDKIKAGYYRKATADDLELARQRAKEDPDGWRDLDAKSRQNILMNVADEFRKSRGDLIGIAAAEVGKVFTETDVEVSEAIDFLNFYPYSVDRISNLSGVNIEAKGVGLVISPWNFPIAIPTGGVAAALAAGNTVILKPSSDAILCGYRICQCFWDAGVGKNTLQFVPTGGSLVSKHLVPNPDIDFVIFTGGEQTAYDMIKARPSIALSAETGGKGATIVTAMADRDQAINNVITSAFSNSGQKCSATSLLVLEKEVYEDENFKQALIDAVQSLEVGSVWDFKNRIGTLANLPTDDLKTSLSYLDKNETWVIAPSYADNENPYMLKPSIRWGTQKGDFCHMKELFGPVLSVMCANDLNDAIEIVNATGYGLTSGLESLDRREQEVWRDKLLAGNLYINRPTTGAIVTRQPFGGMRKSAIGSGRKAGGFNYVSQFMHITYDETNIYETCSVEYLDKLEILLSNENEHYDVIKLSLRKACYFSLWLDMEFKHEYDYAGIRGESNIIRYLPVKSVLLRVEENDNLSQILSSVMAIKMLGAKLHLSLPKTFQSAELLWLEVKACILMDQENDGDVIAREDETALIKSMSQVERIRFLQPENVSENIYEVLADQALYIASDPFVSHGRIELMHYFIEQSISDSYHRYGNLGQKGILSK